MSNIRNLRLEVCSKSDLINEVSQVLDLSPLSANKFLQRLASLWLMVLAAEFFKITITK